MKVALAYARASNTIFTPALSQKERELFSDPLNFLLHGRAQNA